MRYTVVLFIFVGVNFLGLAETEMFVDIRIHGFNTLQMTSLVIYAFCCALNFAV